MSGSIGQINRLVPAFQNLVEQKKAAGATGEDGNFTEILGKMIESVNNLQLDSGQVQQLLASGEAEDIHQVMLAAEKAGIAMDLLLEIRNKLVDAYQNLIRMPM